MTIDTVKAVNKVVEALQSDREYYQSWQANISMEFFDEYNRQVAEGEVIDRAKLHKIANAAAINFLSLLTRK